ncbi:MAG: hypothetical protein RQ723_00210 [Desulfuromonadales bacterium]|nr:hypothetical protein [Desulfuromonadales bacterium]
MLESLSELVVIFLAIFVLIGLNPALQRAGVRLRKFLEEAEQSQDRLVAHVESDHAALFAEHSGNEPLNDFETIVLRRIAQARGKALSRRQINESLLFGDAVLKRTLRSLHRRGLLSLQLSRLLGPRFALSASGLSYAREQGYIVELHRP